MRMLTVFCFFIFLLRMSIPKFIVDDWSTQQGKLGWEISPHQTIGLQQNSKLSNKKFEIRQGSEDLSQRNCEAKIMSENRELGMLKMRMLNESRTQNILEHQHFEWQIQIYNLQNLKNSLKQIQHSLKFEQINQFLEDFIQKLQQKYTNIYKIQASKLTKNQSITLYNQQAQQLKETQSKLRSNLLSTEIQMQFVNIKMAELEKELSILNSKKKTIEHKIKEYNHNLQETQTKIKLMQKNIAQQESQIEQLITQQAQIKKEVLEMQTRLKSIEPEYQIIKKQHFGLSDQISSFSKQQENIHLKVQKYLQQKQIPKLQQQIKIQQKQNFINYAQCYFDEGINLSNLSIKLSSSQLLKHLQLLYSTKLPLPQINSHPYKLSVIDLFGSFWKSNFGFPFDFYNQETLQVKSDLTCLSLSYFKELHSSVGQIILIRKNMITVFTFDKKQVTLLLGVCSRLQSTNLKPPSQGCIIYFRGFILTETLINVQFLTIL